MEKYNFHNNVDTDTQNYFLASLRKLRVVIWVHIYGFTVVDTKFHMLDMSVKISQTGCAANPQFCKIFAKNCKKMKELDRDGGRAIPCTSLYPQMVSYHNTSQWGIQGGTWDAFPLSVQFLPLTCNFCQKKLSNNRLAPRPLGLAPTSGKSWIRHWWFMITYNDSYGHQW